MGIKTAVIGGMIGYGIAKWLDQSRTGRTIAGVGVKFVDGALSRFHEMTKAAAEQDQAAYVPQQKTDESMLIKMAREHAARILGGQNGASQ